MTFLEAKEKFRVNNGIKKKLEKYLMIHKH